ncbi:MAG: ATP synthase subunit I [Desulfobacteraceae bacterium]|nr:ATP synthase subunit I [Desulfobacteraceae bacterium]
MERGNRKEKSESNDISKIQKRICSWAMASALVLAFFFIFIGEKAIAKGLVLGTCFSILNFVLLGRSIAVTLGHTRRKAGFIGFVSIFSRYIILAVPLVVAIKFPAFDFIAAVIGVFAVQIVTLVDYVVIRPILDRK